VVTGKISSWFDGWSRTACALVLATLIAIMALSALTPSVKTGSPPRTSKSRMTDAELYAKVISEVRNGTPYYASVVRNHRENGYPLRPFFTVRMPTLATLSAMLPPSGARFLLLGLIVAAGMAWFRLFVRDLEQRAVRISALVLVAVSLTTLASPVLSLFHDAWAGVLMALALALNQQRKVAASIAVGLAAALIRELAIPFLLLMATAAAWERKWREVAGWAAAIALVGGALIVHARALSPLVTASDLHSQGWKGMGGWSFYLSTMTIATPLSIGPAWLARMLIPLALFGWFAWQSPLALRVSGLLIGYGILLAAFSRPDTFYWGLMMTPLLLAGLALAPLMIARLLGQIGSPREVAA
jgi:hypothetical protein